MFYKVTKVTLSAAARRLEGEARRLQSKVEMAMEAKSADEVKSAAKATHATVAKVAKADAAEKAAASAAAGMALSATQLSAARTAFLKAYGSPKTEAELLAAYTKMAAALTTLIAGRTTADMTTAVKLITAASFGAYSGKIDVTAVAITKPNTGGISMKLKADLTAADLATVPAAVSLPLVKAALSVTQNEANVWLDVMNVKASQARRLGESRHLQAKDTTMAVTPKNAAELAAAAKATMASDPTLKAAAAAALLLGGFGILDSGLSGGAIAGIVIGTLVGVVAIAAIIMVVVKKKNA
jgi:hypothetical protein